MKNRLLALLGALMVGWLALGCAPAPLALAQTQPTLPAQSVALAQPPTIIVSPPHGSQYQAGDDVAVQSTWNDPNGVARVELSVDGTVLRSDAVPQPQTSLTVIQTWTATGGVHILTVRAFNQANQSSNPATITITVAPAPPAAAPTLAPTSTPSVACTNNAAFVVDVTVPDGTLLAPDQAFNKIWRLRNTGTCAWGEGYTFDFVSGDRMGAAAPIGVPNTAPGTTADLLVPMTAPTTPGAASGFWRLRSPDGTPFGVTLSVRINVISPAPSPTPTLVPTLTPTPVACSGAPIISSFTASATTINPGQSTTLSWGLVGNAQSAVIDNGIGGVATPGSTTVSPSSTTTYTMTATCQGNIATSQVTINVVPVPTATATATATSAPATSTATSAPPTPTATATSAPSTSTPTRTRAPTRTATPTRTPTR